MGTTDNKAAFAIYCLTTVVLCLNMLGLWGWSAGVRGRTKTVWNPEDTTTVAKGTTVVTSDPPEVARVLRAHTNAFVNIMPFLVLGYLYVLLGATPTWAWILFGGFTFLRLVHTFAYLNEKQPWRTLSFVLGGIVTFVLMVQVARGAVALMM
jgi:uncharacterized MAPEG superfamily protein